MHPPNLSRAAPAPPAPAPRAPSARRQSPPRSAAGAPPRRNARHASLASSFRTFSPVARTASASAVLRAANAACHASSMPAWRRSGASSRRNDRSSARRGGAPVGKPRATNHGTPTPRMCFRRRSFSVRASLASASSSAKDADATARSRSKWSYACPARCGNDAVNAARSKADSGDVTRASFSAASDSRPSVCFFPCPRPPACASLASRAGSRPGPDRGTPLEAERSTRRARTSSRHARRAAMTDDDVPAASRASSSSDASEHLASSRACVSDVPTRDGAVEGVLGCARSARAARWSGILLRALNAKLRSRFASPESSIRRRTSRSKSAAFESRIAGFTTASFTARRTRQ